MLTAIKRSTVLLDVGIVRNYCMMETFLKPPRYACILSQLSNQNN